MFPVSKEEYREGRKGKERQEIQAYISFTIVKKTTKNSMVNFTTSIQDVECECLRDR